MFRQAVSSELHAEEDKAYFSHACTLSLQGVWTKWTEMVDPCDLSWKNLLYSAQPRLFSFILNSTINCLPTPEMLSLWGYRSSGSCPLCAHPQCTLSHILVGCSVALSQKRYTWRHDSVLAILKPELEKYIQNVNCKSPSVLRSVKFSSSSSHMQCLHRDILQGSSISRSVLDSANDWQLLIDFDHCHITFPVNIYLTAERPDIIIFSLSTRSVVLIELTCPAEENIGNANSRKTLKYKELCASVESEGWAVHFYTIEVGCRGFPARSVAFCLKSLGFGIPDIRRITRALSKVASFCSFTLFRCHNVPEWSYQPPFV